MLGEGVGWGGGVHRSCRVVVAHWPGSQRVRGTGQQPMGLLTGRAPPPTPRVGNFLELKAECRFPWLMANMLERATGGWGWGGVEIGRAHV